MFSYNTAREVGSNLIVIVQIEHNNSKHHSAYQKQVFIIIIISKSLQKSPHDSQS